MADNGNKKNDNLSSNTLANIQNLQNMEKELYKKLDTGISEKSITKEEQDNIIGEINNLSSMRSNLYSNLKDMYKNKQQNVSLNRNDLVNQLTTSSVIENELNNAKSSFQSLEDDKNNKLRMVEINTYFGSRYRAYSQLMKHIIYFTIPILILAFLSRRQILSSNIANALISLIIAVAIIYLGREIYDLSMRDNMNFDEYTWNFNPNKVSLKQSYKDDDNDEEEPNFFNNKDEMDDSQFLSYITGKNICQGDNCCSANMTYNKELNKCVVNNNSSGDLPKRNVVEEFSPNNSYAPF